MVGIRLDLGPISDELVRRIRVYGQRVEREIDAVMQAEAGQLRSDIVALTPVDTGRLRAAWQGPTKIGPAHYELRNETPYGVVVERGGYRGVGPKTAQVGSFILPGGIQVNGGIYPTQRPAGFVRQALSMRVVDLNNKIGDVLRSPRLIR